MVHNPLSGRDESPNPFLLRDQAFDRFLAAVPDSPYQKRADLYRLGIPDLPAELLVSIKNNMNEALAAGELAVPDPAARRDFAFDFIDSEDVNAFAAPFMGCSFIGITVPLTSLTWHICGQLSASSRFVAAMGLSNRNYDKQMLQVMLFRLALNFVVTHEWAHHKRGHLSRQSGPGNWVNEIDPTSGEGGLESQSIESDADGYAVYFVLNHHIIEGEGREHAVDVLGLGDVATGSQDLILFLCFLAASTSFLFVQPTPAVDSASLPRLKYPPQAARLHCLITNARIWSRQARPTLAPSITSERLRELTASITSAIWEPERNALWASQLDFFRSAAGFAYLDDLTKRLDTLKESSGLSENSEGLNFHDQA